MAKYKKHQQPPVSIQTQQESEALAKATQRPGQTKDQTKLIAQGIQKGIEEYKKRQKVKARELDKKLKRVRQQDGQSVSANEVEADVKQPGTHTAILPWVLLIVSWVGFIGYWALKS